MRLPASRKPLLPLLLAAPGLIALAYEPLAWLIRTWLDPHYGSPGGWIAALCAVLALRSLRSGPAEAGGSAARAAVLLVLGAALLRLAGRLLAMNVVGALALCLDVWALGLALRLERRPRAVSPAALAALFALALPVERLLQKLFGHPLRLIAAAAAERLLGPLYGGVQRNGTLLAWNGVELSIELPCSGAQGLLLLCVLAAALACGRRLRVRHVLAATAAVASGALLANTLRIVVLFTGSAAGWPVMAEPWHSLLGLACLALGAVPVLWCAGGWLLPATCSGRLPLPPAISDLGPDLPEAPCRAAAARFRPRSLAAAAFSCAAVAIALAPHRPLDVSRSAFPRALPANLGQRAGKAVEPSAQELDYFGRYGGAVSKRVYRGPDGLAHGVLLVTSSAPLRHLHDPEECLTRSGHVLEPAGVRQRPVPTVAWRSTDPQGTVWRVEVSFISDAGQGATSLSEVIWLWLAQPGTAWSLVERITPWSACQEDPQPCRSFDLALFSALDLSFEEALP
jgi:exosortase/archaeosortase family protein